MNSSTSYPKLPSSSSPTRELKMIKRDPADNRVLEAAVPAKADHVVSGDNDLRFSSACPTVSTRRSASAASDSPVASASSSRWRGR
jgi:hypothetical protein